MAITESEIRDLLDRARSALQQGDKDTARDLLIRLLEQDDRNARAWLLLSGAVDAVEEQRICLENVLTLEPDNSAARQGLEYLNKIHPVEQSAPPVEQKHSHPTAQLPDLDTLTAPTPAPAAPTHGNGNGHSDSFSLFGDTGGLLPTFIPATPSQQGSEMSFPDIQPFVAPGMPTNGAAPSPANGFNPPAETPVTFTPVPEDPWAELRGNMQKPNAAPAPAAPTTNNTNGAPPTNETNFAAPGWSSTPLPAPTPAWQETPGTGSSWTEPSAPFGDQTALRFGDTPLQSITPEQSSLNLNGSAPAATPAPASLPDWAVPIGGAQGTAPSAVTPPWGQPSNGASVGDGLPAQGSFTSSDFNTSAAGMANFAAPSPSMTPELSVNALPADSPWAGAFGGSLGSLDGSTTTADQPQFGAPGFEFGNPKAEDLGSSPSLISRPPIIERTNGAVAGFACPNCGELANGTALSCSRCQFRFYAACPNCGEFVDTTDPSPSGDDACPRCGEHIDKMALGRSEAAGLRGATPKDKIIASIPKTHASAEQAATVTVREKQTQSHARTLIGLVVFIVLIVFLLYLFPMILNSVGVDLNDLPAQVNNLLVNPTPTP